jgi:hypothetical protein
VKSTSYSITPALQEANRNSGKVLLPSWSVLMAAIRASLLNIGTSKEPVTSGVHYCTTAPPFMV